MTKHPPEPNRIIGVIHVDRRSSLVFEQIARKLQVWKVRRKPNGDPVLSKAARCISIPDDARAQLAAIALAPSVSEAAE